MNFQQLRIIRETVRRGFNLTEVANALFTSQSGVSKHIKDLEDELGVELFVRKGKRLLGLTEPGKELVDFGDAIYTSTINDLAVCIAYAVMEKPDPLAAAVPVVKGYHEKFVLLDAELNMLHLLVAMRLLISVTKSARNKLAEPNNEYLLISEKPAWTLLRQWINIDEDLAYYTFRHACGLVPHPDQEMFKLWAKDNPFGIAELFPTTGIKEASHIDMSVGSTWLRHRTNFSDNDWMAYKIREWTKKHPETMVANGYLETRPFYSTNAYRKEGNHGPLYRTVHLGVDFWLDGHTPLHAPASEARVARVARDASVARVARVARDARVASVASVARDASEARVARVASDASDAGHRFACWCIQHAGWWGFVEVSWLSTTAFGARQIKAPLVSRWAEPVPCGVRVRCLGTMLDGRHVVLGSQAYPPH